MAWLIPGWRGFPRRDRDFARGEGARISQLLKNRSCGDVRGLFGANYVLYFEITWLPY